MALKGYYVEYTFKLPSNTRHSSYNYQKLFRAIYGYTQNVTKVNGKTYRYHRKGILSDVPHIRPGKKCSVIIPTDPLKPFVNFLETGKNPAHKWQTRGAWKATYRCEDLNVPEKDAARAIDELLERSYVDVADGHQKISTALGAVASGQGADPGYAHHVLSEAAKIVAGPWFKPAAQQSEKAASFYENYIKIKKK